jgi:hypothetical protein
MDSGNILRMLYRQFDNYEYRLSESYVYSWESDFFAMSKSGYFVEVEIKVSRGDYFRDFEKDKHRVFQALLAKRTHCVTGNSCNGDLICEYRYGSLKRKSPYRWSSSDWEETNWAVHNGKPGYWVNDFNKVRLRHYTEQIYAPATRIYFHDLANKKAPNQLYFACPANLIKLEEIPSYAGLIYCGNEATVIRRAPYIHKAKQNMTTELLAKFYNLWHYKQDTESKIDVCGQYKLFTQKDLNATESCPAIPPIP